VYGEHQNIGDRYRNVVGIFMNQIMQHRPMTLFGDGLQTRAFSYIDDVAPFIANSVNIPDAYNEVINVGADRPYTVRHLSEVVARAFGVPPDIQYLPARNEVLHAYADHAKARRLLGQKAATSLEEGVERMAVWAQGVGARSSQTFRDIDIHQKLPTAWQA